MKTIREEDQDYTAWDHQDFYGMKIEAKIDRLKEKLDELIEYVRSKYENKKTT